MFFYKPCNLHSIFVLGCYYFTLTDFLKKHLIFRYKNG